MTRSLFRALGGTTSALALLSCMTVPVWAENVVYDGTNPGMLQAIANPGDPPNPLEKSVAPSGSESGKSPSLTGNSVTVTNDSGAQHVFGAVNLIDTNAVTNNKVSIDNATVGEIMGGSAATVKDNSVTVSNSIVTGNVYGGYADLISGPPDATVTGNSVTISDSTVNQATGGYAAVESGDSSATASNNKVTISGVTVVHESIGGYAGSDSGTATAANNTVSMSDSTVYDKVSGGWAYSESGAATAANNTVSMSGGEANDQVSGGEAYSGSGTATASNNTVSMSGGTVLTSVSGGHAESTSGTAKTTGNSVTISGLSIVDGLGGHIYGGYAESGSGDAQATGNRVVISGGAQVGGEVYGGWADSDGAGKSGEANNNQVTISGSAQLGGDVYGGFSLIDDHGETGSAVNNTVTISGTPTFSSSSSGLYGGFVGSGSGTPAPGTDAFTGNTLNVLNYSGGPVYSVQNFQYYNFAFPVSQSTPVLGVTGTAVLGANDGTGRGSIVTASTIGGTAPLRPGAQVTLISADTTLGTAEFKQTQAQGQHGATISYLWNLDTTGNQLTAQLGSVKAAPQAKSLSEGFLSGLALVNQGGDLVAGQGMRDAMLASQESEYGLGIFATMAGGWSRYDTGSHLEMSSVSLLTGLSRGMALKPGALTLGAFVEYGTGSYDTYNSFSGIDFDGDGDVDHFGGGIIGRLDFADAGPGHVYTEASFRAGITNNKYSNGHLRDATGRSVGEYDSDSTYYSLHAGLGYIGDLGNSISCDLYGKYFWTRVQGDDFTLASGDPISIKDADSNRVRVGTRLAYTEDKTYTHYAGLAYEHEFDGEAKATTFGYAIDTPDLGGGTGIGEIGTHIKPTDDPAFIIDVGLQGYAGTRQGVSGNLQIRYEF